MNIIWFEMQNVKKIVITEIKFITITYQSIDQAKLTDI